MKKGFVFGKFLPLHKGHLALIDFAFANCDFVYIVLCFTKEEGMEGIVRKQWLYHELEGRDNFSIISFPYDENRLPNTSVSSKEVSAAWSIAFKKILPDVSVVFTSEPYGEFVADFMNIQHRIFDMKRELCPVSASQIRQDPFLNWDFIAHAARPWFVKKIAILGTESTGKSVLTKRLAHHFNTNFVSEAGRELVEKTDACRFEDLQDIAVQHARLIGNAIGFANKLLFLDTDINITRSYARFLFNKELATDTWIDEANRAALCLFLEHDCPFIQDGTRLDEESRNRLSSSHKELLKERGVDFISITGNWDERFETAVKIISEKFNV